MKSISNEFLNKIESLGDNCELGFVMRNLKYEESGLFRWSITPVSALNKFLDDPTTNLYEESDLTPCSPGMVLDNKNGFSFHTKMRSEKNGKGEFCYKQRKCERLRIYEKEKQKIDYLQAKFIKRLQSSKGSLYFIKSNNGIPEAEVSTLSYILNSYCEKHVLIEVRTLELCDRQDLSPKSDTHYVACVGKFAPYIRANDVVFNDWNRVLTVIANDTKIAEKIG